MNLGPSRYSKIPGRVDNTYVSSNLSPSEFSPNYVSRNKPVPTKFHFEFQKCQLQSPICVCLSKIM